MWALVECEVPYHCGERLPRRQLAEHEQDVCFQRPVDIKLESFMRKMEERHIREIFFCFERGFEKGKRESQIGHRKDEQEREQYVEEKLAEQESKMRVQCTMNFMFMHIIIIVCYCVN